ncbi:hypothetical protein BSR29_00005, partial [Boudabousia liubingyangii]
MALAASLGVVTLPFVTPEAQAYTAETVPGPALEKNPVAKATMEHTFADGVTPAAGATFTYNGKVAFTGVSGTNLENIYTIYVTQAEKAPFTPAPVKSSLTFTDQNGSPVQPQSLEIEKVNDNTWKYVAKGMSGDITAKFSNEAQIAADATSGDFASASISGEVLSKPVLDMQKSDGMLVSALDGSTSDGVSTPSRGCRGYVTNTWTTKPGAWLLDIKLADNAGKGKVKFDNAPFANGAQQPPNWRDPSTFNSLKVTDASGKDITAEILAGSSYVNPDPSKPQYVIDPLIAKTGNAQWIDSTNWAWDPSTWTGRTWLPAGATVVATHGYTFENCVDPGLSTDGDTNRNIAFSLEVARPEVTANANDNDLIILPSKPGEQPKPDKAWCEDIYVVRARAGVGAAVVEGIDTFNGTSFSQLRDTMDPPPTYGAIAVDPNTKNTIFYIINKTLYQASTTPGTSGSPTSYPPVKTEGSDIAFGIDPFGILWTFDQGGGALYSLNPKDKDPQWVSHGQVKNPKNPNTVFYDITFTSSGDLVLISKAAMYAQAKRSIGLFTFNRKTIEEVRPNTVAVQPDEIKTYTSSKDVTYINGFAVGRDGSAYFGSGSDNSIFKLNENGTATPVPNARVTPGIGDMGSCSYLPPATPPVVNNDPKFQVQKSALDPVTGAPAVPGSTTENSAKVSADGATTIQYLVTVANTGGGAGDPGDVTDTIAPPKGFTIMDVLVDGKSVSANNVLTLRPGNLEAGAYKSYKITVKLQADSLEAGNNAVGDCNTEGPGQAGGGFFNSVTMSNDSDGADNNDACVPVKPRPKAHLKLVKQIVDQNGQLLSDQSDAKKFQLSAGSADPSQTLTSLNGVTGSTSVDKDVVTGNYQLFEQPSADQPAGQYFKLGDWSCDSGKQVENGKVQINENDNVTCTVQNTRMPLVHVEKVAADPSAGNSHVGKEVTPVAVPGTNPVQYRADFEYIVKVVNDSNFKAATGPVKDFFIVPAGMKWEENATAKVEFQPGESGLKAQTQTLDEKQMTAKGGAILSNNLLLPANASVSFKVTIPLVLDLKVDPETGTTAYAKQFAKLGECENIDMRGDKVTTTAKGVGNRTEVQNENLDYNKVPILDNIACIPVKPIEKWNVEKVAVNNNVAGAANGDPVVATKVGENYQATVKYLVTVTNTGLTPSRQPAIADAITLPENWTIVDIKVGKAVNGEIAKAQLASQGTDAAFEIPAGAENGLVAVNGKVQYVVEVTGQVPATKIDWEKAGECKVEEAGTAGTGFFNKVSIPGDEGTDNNNDACVPVTPGSVKVLIRKTDDTGKLYLPGAKFKVCDANPNAKANANCVPLDSEKDRLVNECKAKFDPQTKKLEFETCVYNANLPGSLTESTFQAKDLVPNKVYWLVETQAPQCYTENKDGAKEYCASLLPQPLQFKVSANGVITAYDTNGAVVEGKATETTGSSAVTCNPLTDEHCNPETCLKQVDNTFYIFNGLIKVHDPRRGELPISGGTGPMPYALAAGLLLLLSLG